MLARQLIEAYLGIKSLIGLSPTLRALAMARSCSILISKASSSSTTASCSGTAIVSSIDSRLGNLNDSAKVHLKT